MIGDYIKKAVVPAVLIAGVFLVFLVVFRKKKAAQDTDNKRGYQMVRRGFGLGSLALLAITLLYCEKNLKLFKWIRGKLEKSTFIEERYVDPENVKITFPKQKRNLVYVYLESMEVTFTDPESGGAFRENLIPELTEISLENEDFCRNLRSAERRDCRKRDYLDYGSHVCTEQRAAADHGYRGE